jgi:hypothetical protein
MRRREMSGAGAGVELSPEVSSASPVVIGSK